MTSLPLLAPRNWLVVILAPVYRDWDSASLVCKELDQLCAALVNIRVQILLVNDGSPGGVDRWQPFPMLHLEKIEVLHLRRNVGHQRAIAVGLCHIDECVPCDAVVVMDADGEDRPSDVLTLLRRGVTHPDRLVFAARRKRPESWGFQLGYLGYRWLHRTLTGIPVRMGNFSFVPFAHIGRLVSMSELWNHYAGAVFRSKLDFDLLPIDRGSRYFGHSQMNLISLVNHGLSGIASFHDVVCTRILIANVFCVACGLAALAALAAGKWAYDVKIPDWATYAASLVLILLAQFVAISFSLIFTLLVNRTNALFVPARDYHVLVHGPPLPVNEETRIHDATG